jgi:hypothetical protein
MAERRLPQTASGRDNRGAPLAAIMKKPALSARAFPWNIIAPFGG